MKLTFGFGTDMQEVEVPERNLIGELHANDVPLGLTGEAEVIRALREPIGAPRLKDIVRPGERIAIDSGISNTGRKPVRLISLVKRH